MPRRLVTDLLDILGVLLLAAGVGFLLGQWIGWAGLIGSAAVVLGGSQLAAYVWAPRKAQP